MEIIKRKLEYLQDRNRKKFSNLSSFSNENNVDENIV